MENKMEHEIENGQLIISFYGEIDGYMMSFLILNIRLLSIVQG